MGKYFREHRATLADSLATEVSVSGLGGIKAYLKQQEPVSLCRYDNVRIDPTPYVDNRLPRHWGLIVYHVIADVNGEKDRGIGFCNFK